MNPGLLDGVEGVGSPEPPLFLLHAGLRVDSESWLGGLEDKSQVFGQATLGGLQAELERFASEFPASLNAAVKVDEVSVGLNDSVIEVCLPSVVLESEVDGVLAGREPDLEFVGILVNLGLLVKLEVLLDLDSGGGRLLVELEGQFVVDEVIIKNRGCTLIDASPGLGLE